MESRRNIDRVIDLTDPGRNIIYNMSSDDARALIASGDPLAVRSIDGQFALVAVSGKSVRLARSIGRPLRYFIAKKKDGPCLIASDRVDGIQRYLQGAGLADQFHPSYTRMAPAHYITDIQLVGCPDPNPTYERFFTPQCNTLDPDVAAIGCSYVTQVYDEIVKWLTHRATKGPIGVCFSGGIDSGSVFVLTHHAMVTNNLNPARLKAFTLSVDGGGDDLLQAHEMLEELDLGFFLECIEVRESDISWQDAVQVVEDYKPLDIQAAAMGLALCRGIRSRYPEWRYLIDGDGGDENLKDYPIEENPELTIRSVLNNSMLYQEGWGVDSIKHSLTYSGGLSRSYARTYAPSSTLGFDGLSPYTLPNVIEIAEAIPFIRLTDWNHERLYDLKGQIVSAGVEAVTGMLMPIFPKRRFQHGAATRNVFERQFPRNPLEYRRAYHAQYEA